MRDVRNDQGGRVRVAWNRVGQLSGTTMLDAAPRPLVDQLVAVAVHGNASPWAAANPAGGSRTRRIVIVE